MLNTGWTEFRRSRKQQTIQIRTVRLEVWILFTFLHFIREDVSFTLLPFIPCLLYRSDRAFWVVMVDVC